jgi:hypothetical protein
MAVLQTWFYVNQYVAIRQSLLIPLTIKYINCLRNPLLQPGLNLVSDGPARGELLIITPG